LLDHLGQNHRRLGQASDNETSQRASDFGVAKSLHTNRLFREAAAKHVVSLFAAGPSRLDGVLNMRQQRCCIGVSLRIQCGIGLADVEKIFEQSRRPDNDISITRHRRAEIRKVHLEGRLAGQLQSIHAPV